MSFDSLRARSNLVVNYRDRENVIEKNVGDDCAFD